MASKVADTKQEEIPVKIVNLRSRVVPGIIPVTAESKEESIKRAIDLAGESIATSQPAHREWDWRECEGDKSQVGKVYMRAYVHWYDISDDWNIIPILIDMVKRRVLLGSLQVPNMVSHMKVVQPGRREYRRWISFVRRHKNDENRRAQRSLRIFFIYIDKPLKQA